MKLKQPTESYPFLPHRTLKPLRVFAVGLFLLSGLDFFTGGVLGQSVQAQHGPFVQVQELTAPDALAGDAFGSTIAFDGTTLVVGAPLRNNRTGTVYVFEFDPTPSSLGCPSGERLGEWKFKQQLNAPTGDDNVGDDFGSGLAVDGDVIVVGARTDGETGLNAGAAYVFRRNVTGWVFEQKLRDPLGSPGDEIGLAIAVEGDRILLSAELTDGGRGSIYYFEKTVNDWVLQQEITPLNRVSSDRFGHSFGLDGDRLLVGAFWHDGPRGIDSGAVYVFELVSGVWEQKPQQGSPYLVASDGMPGDRFGDTVALDGDKAIIGAYLHDHNGQMDSGSAYAFQLDNGVWSETQELHASDPGAGDLFSLSPFGFDRDVAIVGALLHDVENGMDSGSAYVYRFDTSTNLWSSPAEQELVACNGASGDLFSGPTVVKGGTSFLGASGRDANGLVDSGSVYAFVSAPNTGPTLKMPSSVPTPFNLPVTVPISFMGNGSQISATTFSVDFDETCLALDPADISFSVPVDFTPSVTYSPGDALGELDFTILDFSPPLSSLPDGVLATITFTPTCPPAGSSVLAAVDFSLQPPPSFGDTGGQSVSGSSINGSVEILPGEPGDCNGDGQVDAGDLAACVLEVFDGDGSIWTDVINGAFPGNPVGCDANQDFRVDAGDVACKVLLIFQGSGACGGSNASSRESHITPRLRIGREFSSGAGDMVSVPLIFQGQDAGISASVFSIDYDETCLSFDPKTGLRFNLPPEISPSMSFDPEDTEGEIDISLLDSALPFVTLGDGELATLTFTTTCEKSASDLEIPIRFGTEEALSFGNTLGESVPAVGVDGAIVITQVLFLDGFESGDTSRWSSIDP